MLEIQLSDTHGLGAKYLWELEKILLDSYCFFVILYNVNTQWLMYIDQ